MTGPEHVKAARVMSPDDATALVGSDVPALAPTVTTATVAFDADTGEPVYAYLPVADRAAVGELRRACRTIGITETYRAASGRRNKSRTFGWAPRRPVQRRESCNATSLAQQQPAEHAVLDGWAARLTGMIRDLIDPAVLARDQATVAAVLPEWRMHGGDSVWTSGVVNQSSQLPYHRDGFNFPTWSAMPVVRRGMDGGCLHLPEYGATLACRDGWAVFFCGFQLVHGVTPMRRTSPDGYRYSIVYYSLRGMKDCATFAEETRWARARRTERERGMAAAGVTPDVAIRQVRPALQRWLADNHPAPAYVKVLPGDPPRLSVASETNPGITEWAGHPVAWLAQPAQGRGVDDADRAINAAPDDPALIEAAELAPPTVDHATLTDLATFAKLENQAHDIEPWAELLAWLRTDGGWPTEQALWAVKLYNAYDDLGSAMAVMGDCPTPDAWLTAPAPVKLRSAGLPISGERRNLRGGKLIRHLDAYTALLDGAPQQTWLLAGVDSADPAEAFDQLHAYLQRQVWGVGRLTAFEWAEFAAKVAGLPVAAGHGCLWESSGPRESLERIWGRAAPDRAWLDARAADVKAHLAEAGTDLAWWDVETVICDFNVMRKGRYYPGQHLAMLRAEVDTTTGPLRAALDAAWRAVVPDPWAAIPGAVSKQLRPVYKRTGRIVTPLEEL